MKGQRSHVHIRYPEQEHTWMFFILEWCVVKI